MERYRCIGRMCGNVLCLSGAGKMATVQRLLHPLHQKADDTGSKVTVVGAGQVGMAAVFSMLTQVTHISS